MGANKICFNDVRYRQGFLEVTANIHPGHINLETWQIHPDLDISGKQSDEVLADDSVTANTEIELNVEQAKALVASLEAAIARASVSERPADVDR
ncbi:hypothetical protein DBV14_02145 [Variovorax sp. KBW07]|uniref:hypothetical protein n=1 Tax=Variovorax sp. KBW07 TaxID=2153358 RepID=UPI000F56D278|nr:hypothetical protein [Variovorax sp. KBW07]RQO63855.1 hypothetical protein DBV14_02145 [Variovorax sp. KBW07]